MASSTIPPAPFDPATEDWDSYMDRFQMFLESNNLKEATPSKKRAVFLTHCGPAVFKMAKALAKPAEVKTMDWDTLAPILHNHYGPGVPTLIRRHEFYQRDQREGPSANIASSQTPVETVVSVELDVLETLCHVLDPTPVKNCTVRQQNHHAVKSECVVRIHRENGDKVSGANCHSKPDSVENVRRNCPKCPILVPLNDPHVVQSVEYVLHKHNEKQPNHAYEVLEISRGQHKYEPEAFYVEFAIVETNCSAQEAHNDHHDCHPKAAGEAHIGFCRATVFRSHAALEKPKDEQYESDCVIFDVKEGHSHTHLIEHHYGKNIASPGHNNTVLDLVHSHNHTSASHESHSHEHVAVPVVEAPVAKREAPTEIPHDHTHAAKLCPGKVHHFKV